MVSGTATRVTPTAVLVRLDDSAVSPQSGLAYRYEQSLVFGPPACSDTIDNDGDTKIDLLDPGCASATDASELSASNPCDDGIDNDADGKIDFADPGCGIAPYDNESRKPGCGLGAELPLVLLVAGLALRARKAWPRASGPPLAF